MIAAGIRSAAPNPNTTTAGAAASTPRHVRSMVGQRLAHRSANTANVTPCNSRISPAISTASQTGDRIRKSRLSGSIRPTGRARRPAPMPVRISPAIQERFGNQRRSSTQAPTVNIPPKRPMKSTNETVPANVTSPTRNSASVKRP